MDANDARPAARPAEEDQNPEIYAGPGAHGEITLPPTDPVREAKRRDIDDPADVDVDPQDLLDGGPARTPGAVTTTGGTAGRASARRRPRSGRGVAPTTTGDATTGGMNTPQRGSTSDAVRRAT